MTKMEVISGTPKVVGFGAVYSGLIGSFTDYPAPERVSDLRRSIGDLHVMRADIATIGIVAYSLLVSGQPTYTATVPCLESAPPLTVTYSPVGTAHIDFQTTATISREALQPWSPVFAPLPQSRRMPYGSASWPSHPLRLAVVEKLFTADRRAAFLRLLDGLLAVLCLLLVRVLAALSRRPDVRTFVLVMLAVCLRYGRREESDDYALPAPCRHERSLGSCALA